MTAPKLRRAVLGVSPSRASRILDGIHLMRIPTQTEMIAFWHTLEDWMVAHPKVTPSSSHTPARVRDLIRGWSDR